VFRTLATRAARASAIAALLAASATTLMAPSASGAPSLDDLRARMDALQRRLDATTAKIEGLRTEADMTQRRIVVIEHRKAELLERSERLQGRAAERADELYRTGGMGALEVLFASGDFSDLTDRAEMLSQVSLEDSGVFTELSRSRMELGALARELEARRIRLRKTTGELRETSAQLQDQFAAVSDEYGKLKAQLERAAAAAARREQANEVASTTESAAVASFSVPASGGMVCPVAGAVSFVDSWGAPRAGHSHQGVDMMAAYGTPLVAIVSGTITYAAYDGSGGNMIFLSGDDGNAYWYMHNQDNLVSGGHVSAGQQIATVGDTGNAVGTPHLHFEYHPGGGAAVNPYPLVASIC
jgi:murein DD-endopeptidase MepM/ murein hydrolase activator NlpD